MMAFVYKRKRRQAIPDGAEIIRRRGGKVAKWVSNGRTYTADVDGDSVIIEGCTYQARWRGADGTVHDASTGCRDKDRAEKWLSRKTAEAERVISGVITQREADMAVRAAGALLTAVDAFASDMTARGRTPEHVDVTKSVVKRCADACGWRRLCDMDGIQAGAWLRGLLDDGKAARTYNKHLVALKSFGTWCVKQRLILINPFQSLSRLSEKADRRYERRALTTDEVSAIIEAARTRPIAEAAKCYKGAALPDNERARLDSKGWNRALCYRLMSVSGLRYGEARALRISDIHTEADTPYVNIQAGREKARRGAKIPLHGAIVDELASFIKAREKSLTGDCGASVVTFPGVIGNALLFDDLPLKVSRQFKGDCKAAGVMAVDASGRVADVHCLRYYFGTELARAGVPLHIVQKLMRHSTPDLTSNVYVHATLTDLSAAVDLLPDMGIQEQAAEAAGKGTSQGTPKSILADGKTLHFTSSDAVMKGTGGNKVKAGHTCVSPNKYRGKAVNEGWQPVGDSNPCDGTENPGAYAEKPNKNGGNGGEGTLKSTPDDAKTSQTDGIREALAAMSKDDLIALLADALAPSLADDAGGTNHD